MSDATEVPKEYLTDIESFVADWMTEFNVPGASIAIVDGDETVYEAGFGARHRESNTPATPDTLYGIGSATKTFTALAVRQLVERGELGLEDPIFEYVPALEDAPGDPITIRQLLTHTSGMPSDGLALVLGPRLSLGLGSTIPLSDEDDFYRHVNGAADRRITDSGDKLMYYNAGYVLLGKVLEAVTGQRFSTYVEDEILDPLGMERSTLDPKGFEETDDTMTPYFWNGEEVQQGGLARDQHIVGAGGLSSSASELATFLAKTVTGDDRSGVPDVDAETIEAMQRPQGVLSTRLNGQQVEYGHGWMSQPFLDDRLVGHGGAAITSSVGFWGLRDGDLGVAVACNTAPEVSPRALGEAILAILHDRNPERTVNSLILREKYDRICGEYALYRGTQEVTIEQEGQMLQLTQETPFGARKQPLFPENLDPDDLSFYTVTKGGTRVPVEFHELEDGRLEMEQRRARLREQ